MQFGTRKRRCIAAICFSVLVLSFSTNAFAKDGGYVLYLSEYLHGDFYFASLGDVDGEEVRRIRPRKLRLPRSFRSQAELGNPDVSIDGKSIVFAARLTTDYDWDIYTGTIDLSRRQIRDLRVIVGNAGSRDEDPRYSWDGSRIVYKCGGNICIYPDNNYINPVVNSQCELWAPSFDLSGYTVSYTKRCNGSPSDRIWQYSLLMHEEVQVPNIDGGADRFAHFLEDGRIVFSRIDLSSVTSSLWIHDSSFTSVLHDRTESDDDAYPDKHDSNHIAFIGWGGSGYDLFMYRQQHGDSVRLTRVTSVLAPVLFR